MSDVDQTAEYEYLNNLQTSITEEICRVRGISTEDIELFKMQYEEDRPTGNDELAGEHRDAPHRDAYKFAGVVVRLVAEQLKVNWRDYARTRV